MYGDRGVALSFKFTTFLLPLAPVLTSGSSLKVSANLHLAFSPQVPGSPQCPVHGHSASEIRPQIFSWWPCSTVIRINKGLHVPPASEKLLATTILPNSRYKFQGVQGVNVCMLSLAMASFLMNLQVHLVIHNHLRDLSGSVCIKRRAVANFYLISLSTNNVSLYLLSICRS